MTNQIKAWNLLYKNKIGTKNGKNIPNLPTSAILGSLEASKLYKISFILYMKF